jgi:3-phosphoshikimate 1-carboxyvinyltransferase
MPQMEAASALNAASTVRGRINVPGDKSITHRALLLNALANGGAQIRGAGLGDDCRSSIACLQGLGVRVRQEGRQLTIESPGVGGFEEPAKPLDCGNSGTTMRLLLGVLAGCGRFAVVVGDESLSARPMGRVAGPLRRMGARIAGRDGGELAPLAVSPALLSGTEINVPVASAQVKSALLIAGLNANGQTRIIQPAESRNHTEIMLAAMGARVEVDGAKLTVEGGQQLTPVDVEVPGDFSSAAFWLVLGASHPDASLEIANVGINPTRAGTLSVLERMGARIEIDPNPAGAEPSGGLAVASSALSATQIGGAEIPIIIDEIPVLAVAATQAQGTTSIRDAGELRVKETDRIAATVKNLRAMGARIEELPDGMVIEGPTPLQGARLDSHGDHRVAMAMAVAASIASGESRIGDSAAVNVSYPGFFEELGRVCAA